MPELLDISLQLNSCREVAMRSHGTMARGEFLWKSCQRGERDCEGSLRGGGGASVPLGIASPRPADLLPFHMSPRRLIPTEWACSSPATFTKKSLCTSSCLLVGSVALEGKS